MSSLAIISGSHRQNSQSLKVAQYFAKRAKSLGHESRCIDLAVDNLAWWQERYTQKEESEIKVLQEKIRESDALIIVSPEWGGMVPPKLKNFFLFMNSKICGHKAALICAVSAGRGGAFPVAELRASSYKNNYLCYLPEHIIIRDVANCLNQESASSDEDQYIRERMDQALELLADYAEGLKAIRSKWGERLHKYENGMS